MSDEFGLYNPLPENPQTAILEIDAIFANKKHPYHLSLNHPLKEKAQERVNKLFGIMAGETAATCDGHLTDKFISHTPLENPPEFTESNRLNSKFRELVCCG